MPGHYEIVMGERRWRACQRAGLAHIPAIVRKTSDDDLLGYGVPAEWLEGSGQESDAERARRIGNFIAGMTDRYALMEHQRLFDSTPDLR